MNVQRKMHHRLKLLRPTQLLLSCSKWRMREKRLFHALSMQWSSEPTQPSQHTWQQTNQPADTPPYGTSMKRRTDQRRVAMTGGFFHARISFKRDFLTIDK